MIELINWILEEGRDGDDLGAILAGLSERLVARGVPLCRTAGDVASRCTVGRRTHGGH
jgi:hypothetical protein